MLYIERFEHFVSEFNTYLESQIGRADFSDVDSIGKVMNNAVKTYFHIREADKVAIQERYSRLGASRIYNFITFNYTESVDKCVGALRTLIKGESNRQVGPVIHVHGFIEENMIMGVNDSDQIKNPTFSSDRDIIKEIVKPQQNINTRTTYDEKATKLIKDSQIICVYGMSIGCTDAKWWDLISMWLAGNSSRALVILIHDKGANKRFPFKQNKCVDNVIRKFLSYSTQPEEVKQRIIAQIYVGMNHDVFAMPLCKKDVEVLEG